MTPKIIYYTVVLGVLALVALPFYFGIDEKFSNIERNRILGERITAVEAKIATLTNSPINQQKVEVNVTSALSKNANEIAMREFQKTKQQLLVAYPGLRFPGDAK